ncbi:putative E3 ubiquitin-protein ligase LIN isoform X2 [Ricinus communis]|uniref:putative E3 ubiquitin-protein ligase LIN isoform X2 n=1 Tax=Ricinus communis TaxID=3988 RepID=UPI00201A5580|nr:putative E3 ubiquitin-protein ligase LIN isoform X2 [Ricinus communis]
MTSSLLKLLSEEGLVHSEFLRSQKQAKLRDESIKLPIYICHDQKNLDSFKHKTDRASYRKGSSVFSSKQASPDLVRKSKPLSSTEDEPAIDEVAVRTVISILSGYIGRYIKDSSFQKMIRNKCNSCLVRKRKDLDDAIFAKMELGMESIEKLVQEQGTRKELRIKSLRISIQLMSIVASLNSKKSRNGSTCGIPNSHISACAQLYLSIAYKLERNERISARHLLQVFSDSPFLARTHLLPDLWEHLFLPHLLHLKIWYNKELETLSNSQYLDKEKRMKALSKAYNEQIDMGTIQFALYYREWLKVGGKAPSTPAVPLPSRPSSAPSRRRSSDSYSSRSSMNRNLYRAVFGPTPEHLPLELNNQRRDSMDAWALKEGTLHCEEDGYDNYNYAITKMRTHRRSTSQDYRTSKNELWPDRQKSSDHFRFFSCQSVVSECLVKGNHIVRSNSINNVECRDLPLSDLSRAVTTICSSDSLTDCEIAIRVITKSWLDSHGNPVTENALSKASVIEGILEVLLASDDDEVLELAISILAEFVALNEANRLIILNSDPQLEIFMRLLKSSSLFLKAAVLLYLLRPKAKQMISIEWVALALRVLEFGDQLQTLFTIRCIPQKAALYFLDELLNGYSEDKNLENASEVVSLGGLSFLLRAFEIGDIDEKNNAAMLMSCCIQADGSCRNYLAENLNKNSLLELVALGIQKSNRSAFTLLTELLCLNRRKHIIEFLTELNNGWCGLNTMHIFLVYLQRASPEERPLIAAVLLQLDLLGNPSRSSLYREDAVEAIIEALDCHICNSKVQEKSAQALLMLGSHFSYTGEAAAKEWLLQQTGCHDKSVDLFCSNRIIDGNLNEEENAMEDWQRKVAIALLNTGGKRFLAALSNSIANGIQNLAQSCLYTVSWMNRILQSIKDETSQSGAHSVIGAELTESSNYERALYPSILPSKLQHLIKSSECLSILSKLDKELIDPLRNPS